MTIDAVALEPSSDPDIPAGEFAAWLTAMARALRGQAESDVPCGDCTACCEGAYFIAVRPEDTPARARIPRELLFPAPGGPPGHALLGYDENGCCPMLRGGRCSIYADRPSTCRTYDCRVFAATGIAEPGQEKAAIMRRASRWRFTYADDEAEGRHQRLKRGTRFLMDHADALELPSNATQLAMLAVRLHPVLIELGAAFEADAESHAIEPALTRLRADISTILGG